MCIQGQHLRNIVKPLTISRPPKCFLVYFWLLTRRTMTQTIPIHQSIIRLPGRLQNKHTVGVILYHNFPATTSDKMRASRIQKSFTMQISALKILQLPYSTLKCCGKPLTEPKTNQSLHPPLKDL